MSEIKNNNPLVSVFMLVYNHEKYLPDALDGILMQRTEFEYEIVIGDDCSIDNSREVILTYVKKCPDRFRLVFHEQNVGALRNQTDVLEACTGKYIAMCEGDDYWTDPLKLQKQANIFLNYPDTIICGARAKTWSESKKEFTVTTPTLEKNISCMTPQQFFHLGDWVQTCTRMVPRELMISVPANYMMDFRHIHYLLAKNPTGTFRCLDEVVAVYRQHAGGVFSGANSIDQQKEYFESTKLIARLFDDERGIIMHNNALHIAEELLFTSSLGLKERTYYALQFFILTFSHFSYPGMKRATNRLLYRVSTYLGRYPVFKAYLRIFYRFVERKDKENEKR